MEGLKKALEAVMDPAATEKKLSDAIDHLERNNGGIGWFILFWVAITAVVAAKVGNLPLNPYTFVPGIFVLGAGVLLSYFTLRYPGQRELRKKILLSIVEERQTGHEVQLERERKEARQLYDRDAGAWEKTRNDIVASYVIQIKKLEEEMRSVRSKNNDDMGNIANRHTEQLVAERQQRIDLRKECTKNLSLIVKCWGTAMKEMEIQRSIAAAGKVPEFVIGMDKAISAMAVSLEMPHPGGKTPDSLI